MNAPDLSIAPNEAALTGTRFTVPGMRCAGCIAKIERELPKVAGIAAARVNFSSKRVAVEHNPALGEDALIEALLKLGFEAQPIDENPLGSEIAERKQARVDKNFARADEIRDELDAKGVILLDSREGTTWKLK